MKKIIITLFVLSFLFWNTAWAYTYPYTFTKHTGKYASVKDNTSMTLKGYLTPLLGSDDAWVGIRSSWFSIQWAQYTPFLRDNGIYGINDILDLEVFGNISNSPLGLFFENESDPMSILKDNNLKVIPQWLPVYLNAQLYNTLKKKDTDNLHHILNGYSYLSTTKAPWVEIKGKIKDFTIHYSVEMCTNEYEEKLPCAIELAPVKQKFIESWMSENPMTEDELMEKFSDIMFITDTEEFKVNTKIFVAEEIIVNGKNITTIWDDYQKSIDYSSYSYVRSQNLSKLNQDQIKVLDKLVKVFRKLNATWKEKQVQDFMKQLKNVVDSDYKKMNEIVRPANQPWKYIWAPDEYIVSENPSLPKLRERYKLLNTYHTILTPLLKESLEKEKKRVEEKRTWELKAILQKMQINYDKQWSLWFIIWDN